MPQRAYDKLARTGELFGAIRYLAPERMSLLFIYERTEVGRRCFFRKNFDQKTNRENRGKTMALDSYSSPNADNAYSNSAGRRPDASYQLEKL